MCTPSMKTADLREDLALVTGRAKEAEALWERGRADLERLEEGHRRAQSALDARNQEVGWPNLSGLRSDGRGRLESFPFLFMGRICHEQ